MAAYLPDDPQARSQACQRRANDLLDNIREESGILIEKGLDDAGEPVIGFSHLTFQEYLAADALAERPQQRTTLYANLFNPVWRETLLLYVAMVDAGDLVQRVLADSSQSDLRRYLLVGRCLRERVTIDSGLRAQVLTRLRAWLRPPGSNDGPGVDDLLARFGDSGHYEWLLDSLDEALTGEERAGLAWQKAANAADLRSRLQQALLRLLASQTDTATRSSAGCALSAIGDPRDLDEMVLVPAGEFLMVSTEIDGHSDELPQHRLSLDTFHIGAYPVTNGQYARFVAATEQRPPVHWQGNSPPPWLENHPVVNVSWHDAQAYCRWRSQTEGQVYRLPTEAEWEKAARGADGRIYPWGNDWDPSRCNSHKGRGDWTTTPSGMYAAGVSPYDCQDMAGNVWEWTGSLFKEYPYQLNDGREAEQTQGSRVLRGGSSDDYRNFVRCAFRNWLPPDNWLRNFGFRLLSPGS